MREQPNSTISKLSQNPRNYGEEENSLADTISGGDDLSTSEQTSEFRQVEDSQEPQPTTLYPPQIVEGTITESTLLGAGDDVQEDLPKRPQCRYRVLHARLSFAIRVVPLLLLVALIFAETIPGLPNLLWQYVPGLRPSATVTIIPTSADLHLTMTITAVTGSPTISHHEVHARMLTVTTIPQQATIPTTGRGHRPASPATGSVTFYNQLTAPQTIASGTVLSGADEVQVVTEQAAVIPAAVPPVEGQVTVPAHAVQGGPQGNIAVRDINTLCCVTGVAVENLVAFTGGEQAYEYPAVSQRDVEGVSEPLATTLTHNAQSAFQAQVHPDEQEVAPPQCISIVHADHPVGSEATLVTVLVAVTCRGEVYNAQEAKVMAAALFAQQATQQLGPGYSVVDGMTTDITRVRLLYQRRGTLVLAMQVEGVWAYQLSEKRLHALARLIAGKSIIQAKALLLEMQGVRAVTIVFTGSSSSTLPVNPDQITMRLLVVVGM